ncbi:MAG: hypothetical protein LBV59_12905 [Sphingobacterium sp.]|jgi:hypothetical protein|uniref:hypothetical protein n=1 Tax=Sphingobacterium sp. TaxID=341027 RepID=UPI0028472325|nr:hypothetical protein [Sphingobacterium sp.]MDR3008832.1 hypothetical protein [Sphingobacterium sp.]
MNRIIGIWILLLVCFSQISIGQVKDAGYFLEKDNVKVPTQASILPMQNFNFHVKPYQALGTKVMVDSLSLGGNNYIIYTFGLTKTTEDTEYYSFCNIAVRLTPHESMMKLAQTNKIYAGNVSRNHPDYFGQGTLIRDDYRIDFIALTQDTHDICIINSKIYNLSKGRTILLEQDLSHQFILNDYQFTDIEPQAINGIKEHIVGLINKR